ncbi:hypothetical protein ME763_37165 (plasmid) [Streptomyces murinus]|uniref:hypothetical protein n=1 Tax=Streptomyces murinus TaxID=33900 RepID=UPI000A1E4C01|nr:hypothetical protein [Streptomyces murinus]WDO11355.1 hypothetical protein ME763_37165 [Streptomyces murinus]
MAPRFKIGDRVRDNDTSRIAFIEQLPDASSFKRLMLRAAHGSEVWPGRIGALDPAPLDEEAPQ